MKYVCQTSQGDVQCGSITASGLQCSLLATVVYARRASVAFDVAFAHLIHHLGQEASTTSGICSKERFIFMLLLMTTLFDLRNWLIGCGSRTDPSDVTHSSR